VTLHGHYDALPRCPCSPRRGAFFVEPEGERSPRDLAGPACVVRQRRTPLAPDARRPLAREISVDCVSYKDGDAKQPHDYRDCFNHLTHSYY
jgi:hypothetical protein